jgi:hypothetical protein
MAVGTLGGHPVPVEIEGMPGSPLGSPRGFAAPPGSVGEGGVAGTRGLGRGTNPAQKGGAGPRDAEGFRSPANKGGRGAGGGRGGRGKDTRKINVTKVHYIGMSEQRLVVDKHAAVDDV